MTHEERRDDVAKAVLSAWLSGADGSHRKRVEDGVSDLMLAKKAYFIADAMMHVRNKLPQKFEDEHVSTVPSDETIKKVVGMIVEKAVKALGTGKEPPKLIEQFSKEVDRTLSHLIC